MKRQVTIICKTLLNDKKKKKTLPKEKNGQRQITEKIQTAKYLKRYSVLLVIQQTQIFKK